MTARWFFAIWAAALIVLATIAARIVLEPLPSPRSLAVEQYALLRKAPYASLYDSPVGRPDGKGYYDARSFGTKGHMGSDLNGNLGENTDLGDPVYAMADGVVVYSDHAGPGWGNCIIIGHRLSGRIRDRQIDSFYGHLLDRLAREGEVVARGQKIGTIGTADGKYFAHLHFEVRRRPWMGIRRGYHENTNWWHDPMKFLREKHPGLKILKQPPPPPTNAPAMLPPLTYFYSGS